MPFSPEPSDLLKTLYNDLAPWVAARKGYLSLAGDPGEVLEALADGPQSFRVILAWSGDDDQTGQAQAGIVDNTFEVWLIKAKGMKLKAGLHLIKGNPPFLSLLSDLRARVRSLVFPDGVTSGFLLYKGAKQFEPQLALELPTTGYRMTFELTCAIPEMEAREQ